MAARPLVIVSLVGGAIVAVAAWFLGDATRDSGVDPQVPRRVDPKERAGTELELPALAAGSRAPRAGAHREQVVAGRGSNPATTNAVVVTVRGAEANPLQGVAVTLKALYDKQRNTVVTGKSDEHGRVELAWTRELTERWQQQHPGVTFVVEADVPLPEPPSQAVGADPLRHGPVELRLPPAPALSVELVDENGALITEASAVYLFWREPGRDAEWKRTGIPVAHSRGGRATFLMVPPGQELLLRSTGTESRFWAETTVAPRPADAGPHTARLTLGALRERIRVRVLDEQGKPLGDAPLTVGFLLAPWDAVFTPNTGERPLQLENARTGADGRLVFALPMPLQWPQRRVLFVERPSSNPRTSAGVTRLIGFRPLEEGLRPGAEVDLGDLPLGVEALHEVVEGRAVDEDGKPLEGVTVSAQYFQAATGWVRVSEPVVTRADGAFTLRSPHPPPIPVTVRAGKSGYRTSSVEAPHGTRGLVLRLARG